MTLTPPPIDDSRRMRAADAPLLAAALAQGREQLLRLLGAYRRALPDLRVPQSTELNLPLWELGHIGWFEEYWTARNPQRAAGWRAEAEAPRAAPLRDGADALYDSSRVAHATRWQLELPDVQATLGDLARQRERSLELLQQSPSGDDALYFFRLALFHEDMHREAWVYMAQNLGIELDDAGVSEVPAAAIAQGEWHLPARCWTLGQPGAGFCFDNELGPMAVELGPTRIDLAVVSWQRYLPFVEAGGHDERRWWSDAGWAWRQSQHSLPRYLRHQRGRWQRLQFGRWTELDPALPACNLSYHEAQAWCRWAGRRLPTEAEWESAAVLAEDSAANKQSSFEWGQVWEWTASPFAPYPGFTPHPYREYSAPFFDGRPVLRGASFATAPRMKHPRYRNYFSAERNDIFAGFRSCAV